MAKKIEQNGLDLSSVGVGDAVILTDGREAVLDGVCVTADPDAEDQVLIFGRWTDASIVATKVSS